MAYEGRRTLRPSAVGTRTSRSAHFQAPNARSPTRRRQPEPMKRAGTEGRTDVRPTTAAGRTCPRIVSQPAGLATVSKRNRTLGEWAPWLPPGRPETRLRAGRHWHSERLGHEWGHAADRGPRSLRERIGAVHGGPSMGPLGFEP